MLRFEIPGSVVTKWLENVANVENTALNSGLWLVLLFPSLLYSYVYVISYFSAVFVDTEPDVLNPIHDVFFH